MNLPWPIITRTTHERELAAKDAEIAGLREDVRQAENAYNRMRAKWQAEMSNGVRAMLLAADRLKEVRRLEARLAKFDSSNRPRNADGTFKSGGNS